MTNITARFQAISATCVALLLNACATPPVPQQVSMDDGIVQTQGKQSRATKVLNGKNVRLAVVLSKNTINNIKYLQGYKQFCEGGEGNPILQPRMRKACAQAVDPDYLIQWITKSMTSNFGEVKFYDIQDQAKKAMPDVFAVVNIFYNPRGSDGDVADVKIKFFDRNFNYVAAAQGIGKIPADHWGATTVSGSVAISKQHAQVRTTALLSMDQSLSKILVHPVNWHSTTSTARSE